MKKSIKQFFKKLGPGLITGASDDDPSGIATYSQAGAKLGLATLWTAWITFPLMFSIQEMSARIAIVTSKGLISNIKEHYHSSIVYFTLCCCIPAIILNIAADLAAMGAATHLIIPSVSSIFFSFFYSCIILLMLVFCNYKSISKILKYFCLVLFLYFIVPFLVKQNWQEVVSYTFVPTVQLNKDYISLLVAILGTTISPYLFFWQATMESEEKYQVKSKKLILKQMYLDVGLGMFISNLVMYFIILTTGTILFKNGITHIDTVEQAAKALEPLAGKLCYLLFSIGIVGTGLLAIPVFSSCISYLITSSFNYKEGLNKKFHQAKLFYFIISISILVGLLIDLLKISPIRVLIFTATFYGISAPPIIFIIMLICNNKNIMGKYINGRWANLFGSITFILMLLASMLLLYFQF
ncbi:MAG: Nramp family divalent metal transporter [Gammaproteobacteria bacterium]